MEGAGQQKPPVSSELGGATESGGSLGGCRQIATLARGRVAEQHGAEPGQVAGLGQALKRKLARLLL